MSDTPKRILVIDDDPDIQAVLEVVLEDLGGYLVAACQSGPEALVEAPGFAPDLIVLDLQMPGLDGYDTAVRIRQLASRIPLLILTGQAEDDDPLLDAYARELGGTVLRKRMNPEALGQAIAGACGEALPVQWSASARLASRRPRGWHWPARRCTGGRLAGHCAHCGPGESLPAPSRRGCAGRSCAVSSGARRCSGQYLR